MYFICDAEGWEEPTSPVVIEHDNEGEALVTLHLIQKYSDCSFFCRGVVQEAEETISLQQALANSFVEPSDGREWAVTPELFLEAPPVLVIGASTLWLGPNRETAARQSAAAEANIRDMGAALRRVILDVELHTLFVMGKGGVRPESLTRRCPLCKKPRRPRPKWKTVGDVIACGQVCVPVDEWAKHEVAKSRDPSTEWMERLASKSEYPNLSLCRLHAAKKARTK